MLTIGEAAEASGLPAKTVRYYADIGLVRPAGRSDGGYRLYDARSLTQLTLVRRARTFGFTIEACRELLGLYADRDRESVEVKRLARARLDEIDNKLFELQALRDELAALVAACAGDDRPDCPILSGLADSPGPAPGGAAR